MFATSLLVISLFMSLVADPIDGDVPSLEATLAAKRWQRRVVLVYAHERNNPDLLAQQQWLAQQRAGLNERDFEQIVVIGAELSAVDRQYLWGGDRKLPKQATFMTYLIGKDGGVKQRYSAPVAPQTLFRLVDAMPMRQSEMRRKAE